MARKAERLERTGCVPVIVLVQLGAEEAGKSPL